MMMRKQGTFVSSDPDNLAASGPVDGLGPRGQRRDLTQSDGTPYGEEAVRERLRLYEQGLPDRLPAQGW